MPIKLVKLSVWPEASAVANSLNGLPAVVSRCHSPEKQKVSILGQMAFGDLLLHQTDRQIDGQL